MILLNKADLADERQNRAWMEYFKEKGIYAVSIDSRNKGIYEGRFCGNHRGM